MFHVMMIRVRGGGGGASVFHVMMIHVRGGGVPQCFML